MHRTLLTATAFSLLLPHLAGAQDVLDRVVSDLSPIQPLQVSGVTTFDVGPLSLVTGVPMGIERAGGSQLPPPTAPRVTVSGLTLRNALDVMMRLEPGYEWREIDGVIVIRPVASWEDPTHPLRIPAPPLSVPALSVDAAKALVAALLGKPLIEPIRPGEGKTFNLDVRDGTMFDLLNAIVRAHGELAWSFSPGEGDADHARYFVGFFAGASGGAYGVPGRPPETPLDLSELLRQTTHADATVTPVLDRVVPARSDKEPHTCTAINGATVSQLARLVRAPMGIQMTASTKPRWSSQPVPLTGLRLSDALDVMVRIDPRFEWREIDGVIVFRPVNAWRDSRDVLFAPTPPFRVDDVRTFEAMRAVVFAAGRRLEDLIGEFPDTRRISIDLANGTLFDLFNAFVRAHGELVWEFTTADTQTQKFGLRHQVTFHSFTGYASGWAVR